MAHLNVADTLIDETLDFDKAVSVALDFAKNDEHVRYQYNNRCILSFYIVKQLKTIVGEPFGIHTTFKNKLYTCEKYPYYILFIDGDGCQSSNCFDDSREDIYKF